MTGCNNPVLINRLGEPVSVFCMLHCAHHSEQKKYRLPVGSNILRRRGPIDPYKVALWEHFVTTKEAIFCESDLEAVKDDPKYDPSSYNICINDPTYQLIQVLFDDLVEIE
jgi:hypothetical protein